MTLILSGTNGIDFPDGINFNDDKLLSSNGYQKLPGGLIIQWGKTSFPDLGAASSSVAIVFPIAFPNELLDIVATAGVTAGFNVVSNLNESSVSLSGFSCVLTEISAVYQVGGQLRWVAFGR